MAESRAQRRLAAILAADVVGYSRLMEADETGTLSRLKTLRRDIIDPAIASHSGRIVKLMGDGALVEFASAVEAVTCAVEIQNSVHEHNSKEAGDGGIWFRIGINVGDIIVEGDDIYGDGVNIAARLEALAEPGGIFISRTAADQVRDKVPIRIEDRGDFVVKNITRPIQVFCVVVDGHHVVTAGSPAQAASSGMPKILSIAVLPFTNLSGNPEQLYFADGITEDIITELSRYRSLFVIARNSCFQFRGDVDVADVRSALGVRYVVEGSVRQAGNRIRVAAQLIDALDRYQVWAERYDRESRDIFAVQDEVARAVVATLEGRVAARGAEHARRKPTADWAAYDYFLRGRELSYGYRQKEAEPLFARAAELDPNYAHAHAWRAIALGVTYLNDGRLGILDAALASARTALALDDNDARCHYAMAYVALRRCEYDLAGHHHDRAHSLNPNDPEIATGRANWLMHVGRLEEALTTLDAAIERDPFPPTWHWDVRGYVLYHLGRYAEAINAFRSVRAEPFWIVGMLAAAYAQAGYPDDARRELERYLALRPGATLATVADKIIYAPEAMRQHWLDGLRKAGLPE